MNINEKSEILFLYETTNNIPNGDPFTGEQRYDEETKQIQVSDVRIKRFVRDYLGQFDNLDIYVQGKTDSESDDDSEETSGEESNNSKDSGSARRVGELENKYKNEIQDANANNSAFLLKKCIDVRLFGGISTKKKQTCNLTGPVQFALLNNSLNKVELRMHQNTSVLESKQSNTQGAIATTTIVPYSLMQIHGWCNPKVAETTGLTQEDLSLMFQGLWYGTSGEGSSYSRSKVGQNSVLLLQIVYADPMKKVYGLDRLISIDSKKDRSEQIRSFDDYTIKFGKLIEFANDTRISKIRFYTEIDEIKTQLTGQKFELMRF